MKLIAFSLLIYQFNQKLKRLRLSKQQLRLMAEAFKEIGSGTVVAIVIALLIEGNFNTFGILLSLIVVVLAWYISLRIIGSIENE